MLDRFKDSQHIAYKIMTNALKKQKISHAYIIDTNGLNNGIEIAKDFAKSILCPNFYTNYDKCNGCMQCHSIDDGNFIEMKIIEPDGLWIKKEQLDDLQKEFSYKSVIGNKKVYIINGIEFLNVSSANTILKFLEEPSPNIIAILLTKNIYQVLDTIVSRCQIISLNKVANTDFLSMYEKVKYEFNVPEAIDEEHFDEKVDAVIKFVNYVETKGNDTILYTQKLWHDVIDSKELNIFAFEIIILYYKDVINYKIGRKLEVFKINEDIMRIADHNTLFVLQKKIKDVLNLQEQIRYNANTNLLIDRLIIDLVGGNK